MGSAVSRSDKKANGDKNPQRKNSAGRKSSVSTVRDGAKGRMGKTFESPVKMSNQAASAKKDEVLIADDGDDQSDDTTDMSAIPMDPNNQEESLESIEFDDFDALSPVDNNTTATAGASHAKGSKRRASSGGADSRANRRVSFGEGTKQQLEELERQEEENMVIEDDITMLVPDSDDTNHDGNRTADETSAARDAPCKG